MTDTNAIIEAKCSLQEIKDEIETKVNENVATLTITSNTFEFPCGNVPIFEADVINLERLHINNNQVHRITSCAFYNLKNLRYLELIGNGLETLDENVFDDLVSLYSLDLSDNNIENIDNIFGGLDNLFSLVLNNNKIRNVGEDALSGLKNLHNLEINRNQVEELSDNVFQDLGDLSHILLKNNNIKCINNVFSHLKNLHYLDLSHNDIAKLNNGLLEGLTINGPLVDFSFNSLEEIEENALACVQIPFGSLKLNNNKIKTIKTGTFNNILAKTILLCKNEIENIEDDAFKNCHCETLHLEDNSISEVHLEQFNCLTVTYQLWLSNNKISSFAGAFGNFCQLQRLDLDHNQIEEVSSGCFQGLDNVVLLKLGYNLIGVIEDNAFAGVNNLAVLLLHNNQITNLNSNTFTDLPKLSTLDLESNNLQALPPDLFENNLDLNYLNLSHNCISHAPRFNDLSMLRVLNLGYNQIQSLCCNSFAETGANRIFESIMLNNNQIGNLAPNSFDGLEFVCTLNLDNNGFETRDFFNYVPECTVLSLKGNPLENIEIALEDLPSHQIDYIAFENYFFQKTTCGWIRVDQPLEEKLEEIE